MLISFVSFAQLENSFVTQIAPIKLAGLLLDSNCGGCLSKGKKHCETDINKHALYSYRQTWVRKGYVIFPKILEFPGDMSVCDGT